MVVAAAVFVLRPARSCEISTADVFCGRYRRRRGIEGTHSGITTLQRYELLASSWLSLESFMHAIYLKKTGWNILCALVCVKIRGIVYLRARVAVECKQEP